MTTDEMTSDYRGMRRSVERFQLASVATGYDSERVQEAITSALQPREVPCPRPEDLALLTTVLTGHIDTLLVFAEARLAHLDPGHDEMRPCAAAITQGSRARIGSPGPGLLSAVNHCRTLAQAATALLEQADAYRREYATDPHEARCSV